MSLEVLISIFINDFYSSIRATGENMVTIFILFLVFCFGINTKLGGDEPKVR